MERKSGRLWIRIVYYSMIVFLAVIVLLMIWGIYDESQMNKEPALSWVKEETRFISYSVDENKVFFTYELCFENHTEWEITIYSVGISLSKKQTQGWLKHENSYGEKLDNKYTAVIPAGQKCNVTVTFEGEYLGGEPPTANLQPKKLTLSWG